jgi:formamidopyrimidine-DNA glycosylase
MIELPEAMVIAQQMRAALTGKVIEAGNRGNAAHKFAFSNGTSEEYAAILKGKRLGPARGHGSIILLPVQPGHLVVLGGGGERILYHAQNAKLPKKHHLMLRFTEDDCLTVTVQGWGNTLLLEESTAGEHRHVQSDRITPLSDAFTWEYFRSLFEAVDPESSKSVKYFIISEPGVWGIGNGCLQDILYHTGLHPRRRVVDIAEEEQRSLYDAIQSTLSQMVELGGRYEERDLYGNRGGYVRILDSKTKGTPCRECGSLIEKDQYLGGAIYFCPTCQT